MEKNRSGYRILVADDDVNVHEALGVHFRREEYQMLSAYDGEEALELSLIHIFTTVMLRNRGQNSLDLSSIQTRKHQG